MSIQRTDKNILKEEYLEEQKRGFKHSSDGSLIPKRDEDAVAVVPASWDDDWDESIVKE